MSIRSLQSRLLRIKDWMLFPKNVDDMGENVDELFNKLLEDIRNFNISDYNIVKEENVGNIFRRI
ncbi:hypothetical protein [Candidatus Nanopusillus massiliensis]|uniref:hypothetical protein n=1 Tax=Candidatus Nanopusillus massiliensis TaxID=2897163 RepID=UPI001E441EDF|nr:hypothetical protein [Candidatus Nanopusillus massiliensis]